MRRREFIAIVGGAAAWPLAARAQQPKVWRVGVLAPVPPTPAMLSAFRDGLRGRGYVEGQNLSIDVRWPQGSFDQDPSVVTELVNSNADVIVAWGTPATNRGSPRNIDHTHCHGICRRSSWFRVHCQSGATWRQYHWPHQHHSRSQCQADGNVCRTGSRHETCRRGSQPHQSVRDHSSSEHRGRCP